MRLKPPSLPGTLITTVAGVAATVISIGATAQTLPEGFIEETLITGVDRPVGLAFATDGRCFYWTLDGRILERDFHAGPERLVLDLSEETGQASQIGLLGFALDPDFGHNGFVYLLYTVDWEYWITGGKPDPGRLDRPTDTFGRLTRYTCLWNEGAGRYVCEDRTVLIGVGHDTGIPITSPSHGPGTLAFARDGTLLVSTGDGACFTMAADTGGSRECFDNTAESKGILRPKERVGAYRAQLVDCYSGKILRLDVGNVDPVRGAAGVASNPFFDAEDPYAPRSKVWALGLRNPYRFSIRPGTGSLDPADGDPGVLYVGDVGWNTWEEVCIIRGAGANLGWPVYEGAEPAPLYGAIPTANADAPNPLFDGLDCTHEFFAFTDLIVEDTLNTPVFPNPCDPESTIDHVPTFVHHRAAVTHRHFTDDARVPAFDAAGEAIWLAIDDPESPVGGEPYNGRSALGGVFSVGVRFPPGYRDVFFFGDSYGTSPERGWIRAMSVDTADRAVAVRPFRAPSNDLFPATLVFDPAGFALHYVSYGSPGRIGRISWDCNRNGVPDDCDVETGTSEDRNGNGMPDECECPGDLDGSGAVGFGDLLGVLTAWGPCPDCPEDLDGNGTVGFGDVLVVLAGWGPC